MANRWNIPNEVEKAVLKRDAVCAYCGINFTNERKFKPSWDHIINDINIATTDNIVLCCVGCNASKGAKRLQDWLESCSAKKRGINLKTISPIILKALQRNL